MRIAAFPTLALAFLCVAAACRAEPGGGTITGAALAGRLETGDAPVVLDVRTPEEFAAGHIPGALNIPHTELASRLDEIGAHRGDELVVHCRSGKRAGIAEEVLREAGFQRILDLEGHMQGWEKAGRPIRRQAP